MTHNKITLDMAEVADQLGLCPRTIATMVATGELPSIKLKQRRLILVSDLNEFLNARRVARPESVEVAK